MNKVVHFEIVAEDTARAIDFYTKVFGWTITKQDMPGMDYWSIQASPAFTPGAINGGLRKEMGTDKKEQTKSINGYVCVIEVASIDETVTNIENAGGKMMQPKMSVPTVGWLAYALDSEGNMFCVLQSVKSE